MNIASNFPAPPRIKSIDPRRAIFLLIAALYCTLAILYAVLTPPWESPDEPAHYLYAKQLAERARPPLDPVVRQRTRFYDDRPYISSNYEWYQPALGYLPAATIYGLLQLLAPNSLPEEIPPFNPDRLVKPSLFLHSNAQPLIIWGNDWGALAIRIALSLLGLVVIYATYRIGQQLDLKDQLLGLVTAGWVAFLPQFTFISATVRNDTVANAVAALILLLTVQMQTNRGRTNRCALAMGTLLGLGLLTKHSFLYMIPIPILAVILVTPRSPRAWIKPILYVLVPALVLWGTYYLTFAEARPALAYTFQTELNAKPALLNLRYLSSIPKPLLIDLFHARFGWANVTVPATWSWLAFGIWGIGSCLTVYQAIRLRKEKAMRPSLKSIAVIGITLLVALTGVFYYNVSRQQPQGRFLFQALAVWAVFAFWGPSQILSTRTKITIGTVAVGFMLAFNLYALFFCLIPAYY